MRDLSKMPGWGKKYIKKAKDREAAEAALIEALIDEAIGTCEPENADERATAQTRQVLRRKFRAVLER
jgi:hypothetical protein